MSNMFKSLTQKFPKEWYVPVVLAAILCLIISFKAGVADYHSSLQGYLMLPTRKPDETTGPWIALLPQVGQILFAYLYASNTSYAWAKWVYIALHIFDLATDIMFKASGLPLYVYPIAFVESEVVYSFGSEILMTLSLGVFVQLWVEALEQVRNLLVGTWRVLFGKGSSPQVNYAPYTQNQTPPSQKPNPVPQAQNLKGNQHTP